MMMTRLVHYNGSRGVVRLFCAVLSSGCASADLVQPYAPAAATWVSLTADPIVGEPGDTVPRDFTLSVTDSRGSPVAGVSVSWQVTGTNAQVLPLGATTGSDGRASARWRLGTSTADVQSLTAAVATSRGALSASTVAVLHPTRAVRLEVVDSLAVRLGESRAVDVHAVDAYGNVFAPATISLSVVDTTIVGVAGDTVTGRHRGFTRAVVSAAGATDSAVLMVYQIAARILPATDTVRLDALADTVRFGVTILDDGAREIRDTAVVIDPPNAAVTAHHAGPSSIEVVSQSAGVGTVTLRVGAVSALVHAIVEQRAVRIDVQGDQPILMLSAAATLLPLTCTAFDRTDHPLPVSPVVRVHGSRVTGTQCSRLSAAASGHDTLDISAPGFSLQHPLVVALRPIAESPLGDAVVIDSMPTGTGPWAPSARIRSTGEIELYATAYQDADHRGDLHRYVSNDGIHFRYDGVALQRDADPCALRGSAIENVTVIPRNDAQGWRMYFAAGSFPCYGWQVFSAVSVDERNWTIEPGIRLSNGGTVPPDAAVTPPWPTGEGMEVDRLPNGEWRMIVSAYERVLPAPDVWQITEWRSSDQINWRYVGVVVHTDDVPREARASIYAPTIREVAPGLWRMIFTGDNRQDSNGRSRLWTAVSSDKKNWQFEGELIGATGSTFLYSSLAGDRVYFLRNDGAGGNYLAQARIRMP